MNRNWIAILSFVMSLPITSLPASAQDERLEVVSEGLALMKLCRSDFQRLCGNVKPGEGRVLACMQNHAGDLSASCREALPRMAALKARTDKSGMGAK